MSISGGNPGIFVHSFISVTFLVLAAIVLSGSFLLPQMKKLKRFIKEDVNA
jgi:TctA family transporter